MERNQERDGVVYQFWRSATYGLIRRRSGLGWVAPPELWREGRWIVGSLPVKDAVTGLGEDTFARGESADVISIGEAEALATRDRIDLYAEGPPVDSSTGER